MIASKIQPYLQNPKVKALAASVTTDQVLGLGISWSKKKQTINCVRVIVRDKYSFDSFKKFAKTVDEKAVANFFAALPHGHELPEKGLHGNLFALKIDSSLNIKTAFYRRLGETPISYEGGEWFRYEYEKYSDYQFNDLKFPKITEDIFLTEHKCSLGGEIKGSCVYPNYKLSPLSSQLSCFFDTNGKDILRDFRGVLFDMLAVEDEYFMIPVSIGEDQDNIKIYFVDFGRGRTLFDGFNL